MTEGRPSSGTPLPIEFHLGPAVLSHPNLSHGAVIPRKEKQYFHCFQLLDGIYYKPKQCLARAFHYPTLFYVLLQSLHLLKVEFDTFLLTICLTKIRTNLRNTKNQQPFQNCGKKYFFTITLYWFCSLSPTASSKEFGGGNGTIPKEVAAR